MTKKKDPKDLIPRGAPGKFLDANLKVIELCMKKGFTDAELSEVLEITEQTLNNWKKDFPDFFESLKDWKHEADEEIERSLFERAKGYSCRETKLFCHEGMIVSEDIIKQYPPDATAIIFWLKNRNPREWRDRIENANINMNINETYEELIARMESDENERPN